MWLTPSPSHPERPFCVPVFGNKHPGVTSMDVTSFTSFLVQERLDEGHILSNREFK